MQDPRIALNVLLVTIAWIRLIPLLSVSLELSVWEDKLIVLTAPLVNTVPALQNPWCTLVLLGPTLWAANTLALYALLDSIVLTLTSQWSSLVRTEPTPLAVLITVATALEVSNATLPVAQFLNVPLATTRSKETWIAILAPLDTPVL
jgi:hypothetical protein